MNSEVQLLVDAIKSIKAEENFLKDYIFPIAIAFCSSLLGGAVAYFTFKHQDAVLFEKDKLNTANKWIILVNNALFSLQAIKQNYQGKLTQDPYQRVLVVPAIIGQFSPISESLSSLSFIRPKAKSGKPDYPKWSQITLVQAMINNYNFLLDLWKIRSELIQSAKLKIFHAYSEKAYCEITKQMIQDCLDPGELATLIDVTEKVVRLTDDITIELNDFLCNFSGIAESRIKLSKLKNYGSVLKFQHTHDSTKYLSKNVEANYELIAELFGVSAEDLEKRYSTGYEELI